MRSGKHASIRVPIKRQPHRRAALLHLRCQPLWVQRPATVVDVSAIRSNIQNRELVSIDHAQLRKQLWRNRGSGAIRAVRDDTQPLQSQIGNAANQKVNVIFLQRGVVFNRR